MCVRNIYRGYTHRFGTVYPSEYMGHRQLNDGQTGLKEITVHNIIRQIDK